MGPTPVQAGDCQSSAYALVNWYKMLIAYFQRMVDKGEWEHYYAVCLAIIGLVQDCSNSSALAMELLQSCTKPSICSYESNSSQYITDISVMLLKSLATRLLVHANAKENTKASNYSPLCERNPPVIGGFPSRTNNTKIVPMPLHHHESPIPCISKIPKHKSYISFKLCMNLYFSLTTRLNI